MTLNEQQYENIMQALSEARDAAAGYVKHWGGVGTDIVNLINDAYQILESEHYPPEVEKDDLRPDANYKPGHSSDFPF